MKYMALEIYCCRLSSYSLKLYPTQLYYILNYINCICIYATLYIYIYIHSSTATCILFGVCWIIYEQVAAGGCYNREGYLRLGAV